jgi:pimeloyl-ACP methyl ester carboxylesterase
MADGLPTIFVPGLLCSPRLYSEQLPALWRLGPVAVADPTRDDDMAGIARRILEGAPARFALVGLSMGGYVALEIMRQAPERVVRLALLDTSARNDRPEQTENRRAQIAMAKAGRFSEIPDILFPRLVHREHQTDDTLEGLIRLMAEEVGPEAFERQQTAIMHRIDSRPSLSAIRCPTLVAVGDGDELTPLELSQELASGIPGAKLVVIAGAGHCSTLEQPAAVNRALLELMAP